MISVYPSFPLEADLPPRLGGRGHQITDGVKNENDFIIMLFYLLLKLRQFLGEFFVGRKHFPEFYKKPHDGDIGLDGPFAAQSA